MNTRPVDPRHRSARSPKSRARATAKVVPKARAQAIEVATPTRGDFSNPLWLITIAMAVFFGLAAFTIAAD
jgi:hypothetical protein